jgi:hypothetical protein
MGYQIQPHLFGMSPHCWEILAIGFEWDVGETNLSSCLVLSFIQ